MKGFRILPIDFCEIVRALIAVVKETDAWEIHEGSCQIVICHAKTEDCTCLMGRLRAAVKAVEVELRKMKK